MTLTVGPNAGLLINGDAREEHYLSLMRQWRGLDGLIQCHVKDKDLNTPPGSPADGDMYIVGPSPTGAWSSHAGELARYYSVGVGSPGWEFYTPKAGWEARVEDETDVDGVPKRYVHTGSTWVIESSGGIQSIVAGTNVTVDNTDPANPVVSASSSGGDVVGPATSADSEIALFNGASGKSLKRGPVVGTAASANLVTSSTDTTSGRATDVGWMGMGGNGVNVSFANNDFSSLIATGMGAPNGTYSVGLHIRGTANTAGNIAIRNNNLYHQSLESGVLGSWLRVWDDANLVKITSATDITTGRVLTTGYAGLLSSSAPIIGSVNNDANSRKVFGLSLAQSEDNRPAWVGGVSAHAIYTLPITTSRGIQFIFSPADSANRLALRTYTGDVFSGWADFYTTGNTSADVQAMLGSANNDAIRSNIGAARKLLVANVSTANHFVTAGNESVYHRFTFNGAKTVTVRPNSTHALPADGSWVLRNVGTGNLTIVAGSGVVINPPYGGTLVMEPGMTVTLQKVGTDEYDIIGQTVPTTTSSALPTYTLDTVPSAAANTNLLIMITDLTGGREPCFSDGADWLRCSDKTIAD